MTNAARRARTNLGSFGLAAIASLALASCIAGRAPTMSADGRLVVVLGSSTAAGRGASSRDAGWVALVAANVARNDPHDRVWNLARGGLTTFNVLPLDAPVAHRRFAAKRARNIDRALRAHPYAIVVNLPTNDTRAHVPIDEQIANYRLLEDRARSAGVRLWLVSPQPRNFASSAMRQELLRMRAWMRGEDASHFIDVWPALVGPGERLRDEFDSGDGTHPNDAGHRSIAECVIAADVLDRAPRAVEDR